MSKRVPRLSTHFRLRIVAMRRRLELCAELESSRRGRRHFHSRLWQVDLAKERVELVKDR